jgi:hypoxanthine phosphoribosyltransferase
LSLNELKREETRSAEDQDKYEMKRLLTREELRERVAALGTQISNDYRGRQLVLIGALKGAFVFLSDLIREMSIPVKIDFVRVSSYGSSSCAGDICLEKGIKLDIEGKDILIVEDIIDTGVTLVYLERYLKKFKPASVKICTMIDKPERRKVDLKVDYTGHVIKSGFLVGYGLDYNEMYRELPEIYHLKI